GGGGGWPPAGDAGGSAERPGPAAATAARTRAQANRRMGGAMGSLSRNPRARQARDQERRVRSARRDARDRLRLDSTTPASRRIFPSSMAPCTEAMQKSAISPSRALRDRRPAALSPAKNAAGFPRTTSKTRGRSRPVHPVR